MEAASYLKIFPGVPCPDPSVHKASSDICSKCLKPFCASKAIKPVKRKTCMVSSIKKSKPIWRPPPNKTFRKYKSNHRVKSYPFCTVCTKVEMNEDSTSFEKVMALNGELVELDESLKRRLDRQKEKVIIGMDRMYKTTKNNKNKTWKDELINSSPLNLKEKKQNSFAKNTKCQCTYKRCKYCKKLRKPSPVPTFMPNSIDNHSDEPDKIIVVNTHKDENKSSQKRKSKEYSKTKKQLLECLANLESTSQKLLDSNSSTDVSQTLDMDPKPQKNIHHKDISKKISSESAEDNPRIDPFLEIIIDDLKKENLDLKTKIYDREKKLEEAAKKIQEIVIDNSELATRLKEVLLDSSDGAIDAKEIETLKRKLSQSEASNKNLQTYIEYLKKSYFSVFDSMNNKK